MRTNSENPEVDPTVISQGSVAVSPLETGISGIDSATPTPPPEPADLARRHLRLAMAAPRCTHLHDTGLRCGSAAIRGTDLCYYHRAQHAETAAIRALPPVTDDASLQRALQQVLSDLYAGRLRARTAGQLLYGLQILRCG